MDAQTKIVIKLAAILQTSAGCGKGYEDTIAAIRLFIEELDTKAHMLGDSLMLDLAFDAMIRRGKTVEVQRHMEAYAAGDAAARAALPKITEDVMNEVEEMKRNRAAKSGK